MRILCGLLLVVLLLLLAVLGLFPSSTTSAYIPKAIRDDKVLHYFGFLLLTIVVYFTLDLSTVSRTARYTAVLLFAASLASEALQSLVGILWHTGRVWDSQDVTANLLGSSTGLCISVAADMGLRRILRRNRRVRRMQALGDEHETALLDGDLDLEGSEDGGVIPLGRMV